MWPVLLAIGPVRIYSFGLVAVIAFVWGAFVVWRVGREAHFDEEKIFDAVLVTTFWGLVASRGVYVALHWEYFFGGSGGALSWLSLNSYPGLSVWGGLVGAVMSLWGVSRSFGWDFWEAMDIFTPGWLLAWAIGFGGAFLNGSGVGVQSHLPWAVTFPGVEGARHPVQIYGLFLVSLLLVWVRKLDKEYRTYDWYRGNNSESHPGLVFLVGIMFASLMAAGLSLIQPGEMLLGGLSINTWAWLGLSMICGGGIYIRSGREIWSDFRLLVNQVKQLRLPVKTKAKTHRSIKTGVDVV